MELKTLDTSFPEASEMRRGRGDGMTLHAIVRQVGL